MRVTPGQIAFTVTDASTSSATLNGTRQSKIAILASLWLRKRTRSSSSHSSVAKKLSAIALS